MGAQAKQVVNISQAVKRRLNEQLTNTVRNNACLGNSDRELKHLVQDLLNERCNSDADFSIIADAAFLMTTTVLRVAHQDINGEEDYQPRADTLQRIMKVMDIQLIAQHQRVNKKYLPNTKRPDLEDV